MVKSHNDQSPWDCWPISIANSCRNAINWSICSRSSIERFLQVWDNLVGRRIVSPGCTQGPSSVQTASWTGWCRGLRLSWTSHFLTERRLTSCKLCHRVFPLQLYGTDFVPQTAQNSSENESKEQQECFGSFQILSEFAVLICLNMHPLALQTLSKALGR